MLFVEVNTPTLTIPKTGFSLNQKFFSVRKILEQKLKPESTSHQIHSNVLLSLSGHLNNDCVASFQVRSDGCLWINDFFPVVYIINKNYLTYNRLINIYLLFFIIIIFVQNVVFEQKNFVIDTPSRLKDERKKCKFGRVSCRLITNFMDSIKPTLLWAFLPTITWQLLFFQN